MRDKQNYRILSRKKNSGVRIELSMILSPNGAKSVVAIPLLSVQNALTLLMPSDN